MSTDQLIAAFHDGGLSTALSEYQRQRWRRPGLAALEAFVPLGDIGAELVRFTAEIARDGVGPASRAALHRWQLEPRFELHPAAWARFDQGAFLAFGNHVAGIEAALFGAAQTRPDVYHLAGAFVATACPELGDRLLLLQHAGPRRTGRQAPLRERALAAVEDAVWPPRPESARDNLGTLARAAELIADHGAGVHVFPAGSMHRDAPWQPGIGWLVRRLLWRRPEQPVALLPVVYGLSDAHLAASALFRRRPHVRGLARLVLALVGGPPYLYAPAPVPLDAFGVRAGATSREVTEALFALWTTARAEAARAIPGWRDAAAAFRTAR
ncbi:hypothetical protein ABGB07_05605 [Micromonosporaceae bacterium B7E4]